MMMEELGNFATDQSIGFEVGGLSIGTALILSDNKYDMQNRRQMPDGLFVEFRVTETFTVGGGTPVLQFGLMVADDAILATNATTISLCGGLVQLVPSLGIGVENVASPALFAAQLAAGLVMFMPVPRMSVMQSAITGYTGGVKTTLQRYLGACWWQPAWSTSFFEAGRMSARLVALPPNADFGPDGI